MYLGVPYAFINILIKKNVFVCVREKESCSLPIFMSCVVISILMFGLLKIMNKD